jgi:alkylhydroperoxidase family enzyme
MPERYGRLTWFEPESLDDQQRVLYDVITQGRRLPGGGLLPRQDDAGRLFGPFNALLVSPAFGKAFHEAGNELRHRATYTPRCREIAILELAVLRRCGFEWRAHEGNGRGSGLTEDELTAIRTGAPAPTLDRAETLVREVAQALVRGRDIDDALYAAAAGALGERALFEIVMLICYFDTLAMAIGVFRATLPPGFEPPFG